ESPSSLGSSRVHTFTLSRFACHRPPGLDHAFVTADQAAHVAIAHALRDFARQRGPITAAAIHDEFGVHLRKSFLDVPFEDTLAQMLCFHGMTRQPFGVFSHIQEHGLGIRRQASSRVRNRDLLDPGARLVDDSQESRRMIHARTIEPGARARKPKMPEQRRSQGCQPAVAPLGQHHSSLASCRSPDFSLPVFPRFHQDPADVMEITSLSAAPPFVTKDGSEIRELLAYRNSAISNQSLAEARLAAGTSTQEHYHARTEEIYFITAGQGRMRIEGETAEVKAGDAIAIPPGKKHKLWNTGSGPLTLLCCCAPCYEH